MKKPVIDLKKFFALTFELVKIVAICLAIVLPVKYFLIQPFCVKGSSMEPNFHDFEYLIIDELSYRFKIPVRGEVIVFRYPENPKEYFIKRVIGLPGETVEIKNGHVYIKNQEKPNGFVLQEDYIPKNVMTEPRGGEDYAITLTADQYFVLGDNREFSKDSRYFGPVDKNFVIGRVFFRGFPFSRIQVFNENPQYPVN
ncbi:MAG: signal peptidase I [Planctomycetes bacterium]|jgi:signal peptidase I|nr:signal peptidase I [Planctomycetota bacterium]